MFVFTGTTPSNRAAPTLFATIMPTTLTLREAQKIVGVRATPTTFKRLRATVLADGQRVWHVPSHAGIKAVLDKRGPTSN